MLVRCRCRITVLAARAAATAAALAAVVACVYLATVIEGTSTVHVPVVA